MIIWAFILLLYFLHITLIAKILTVLMIIVEIIEIIIFMYMNPEQRMKYIHLDDIIIKCNCDRGGRND